MNRGGEDSIRSYKDLDVWQKSMALAEDCYRVTTEFPREEIYGMTAQIRRAAVSIPANIAEGCGLLEAHIGVPAQLEHRVAMFPERTCE